MKRWDLITSDGYLDGSIECIVVSKKPIRKMRKEVSGFIKKYRDELLHGEQNQGGCSNPNCKVCYPYGKAKKIKQQSE